MFVMQNACVTPPTAMLRPGCGSGPATTPSMAVGRRAGARASPSHGLGQALCFYFLPCYIFVTCSLSCCATAGTGQKPALVRRLHPLYQRRRPKPSQRLRDRPNPPRPKLPKARPRGPPQARVRPPNTPPKVSPPKTPPPPKSPPQAPAPPKSPPKATSPGLITTTRLRAPFRIFQAKAKAPEERGRRRRAGQRRARGCQSRERYWAVTHRFLFLKQ